MELQQVAQEQKFFAPCKVCGPGDRTALSKSAGNADEVKGINVNITEGPIGFGVTASLPELEEEDISLLAEPGNVLTITAERTVKRTVQKQTKNRTFTSTEEVSEFLRRSLKLPDSADLGRVNSSYADGVLTLLVAKHEEAPAGVDPEPVVLVN